jgi:hypothetical protein
MVASLGGVVANESSFSIEKKDILHQETDQAQELKS